MKPKEKKEGDGYFKSVLLAYFVLVLHVLLIAGLLLLVIFLHGIVNYMIWIFVAGSALILFSGYHFYKRMKDQGKTFKEMLRSPLLGGRAVEVNVLGGMATLKIGSSVDVKALERDSSKQSLQLEDPSTIRIRELTELVRLLENDLITLDEYNKIKNKILKL